MKNVLNHFLTGVIDSVHIRGIETIYDKPIKCWVKRHKNTHFVPRWLKAVAGGYFYCYASADHNVEPKENQELKSWGFCTFKDPFTPTYEPLKDEELVSLKNKWLVSKSNDIHSMVTDISKNSVIVNGKVYSAKGLFEAWNYEDGTPAGKKVVL